MSFRIECSVEKIFISVTLGLLVILYYKPHPEGSHLENLSFLSFIPQKPTKELTKKKETPHQPSQDYSSLKPANTSTTKEAAS